MADPSDKTPQKLAKATKSGSKVSESAKKAVKDVRIVIIDILTEKCSNYNEETARQKAEELLRLLETPRPRDTQTLIQLASYLSTLPDTFGLLSAEVTPELLANLLGSDWQGERKRRALSIEDHVRQDEVISDGLPCSVCKLNSVRTVGCSGNRGVNKTEVLTYWCTKCRCVRK